jgi:hypothetical protein
MAPFAFDWDPPGSPPPAAYVFPAAVPSAVPAEPTAKPAETANPIPAAMPAEMTPAAPSPAPEHDRKPEVHAAALGGDVLAMDGKGDEPAWARARPVTWDTDYAGKPSGISTRVRLLWGKGGLYALFELSGAGLHTDTTQPADVERKALYKEDCVELFLTPDAAHPKHYYEVELGPFGHFFDIDVDREHGKQNTGWSSAPHIGTRRDAAAKTATIEVQLAAPEITAALAPGARLPLGLYRIEGLPEQRFLAWSPPRTAKPSFHVPEAFGVLVLDAP